MATNGRLRDYLTKDEVRALLRAAKQSKRYAARNYATILLAYPRGFRASELVELRVCDIDFRAGTLYVRRKKRSKSAVHPMKQNELRGDRARGASGNAARSADQLRLHFRARRKTHPDGFWRICRKREAGGVTGEDAAPTQAGVRLLPKAEFRSLLTSHLQRLPISKPI